MDEEPDFRDFGLGLTEVLFPEKFNERINQEIDKLIADYVNMNFNRIGLYFSHEPIIRKFQQWADGTPQHYGHLIAHSSGIPNKEQKQAFVAARYLRNILQECDLDDINVLRKPEYRRPSDFEESAAAFITTYDRMDTDIMTHKKVSAEDIRIIAASVEKIFKSWIERNKSQIKEIDKQCWEHFWIDGRFESAIAMNEPESFVREYDFTGPIDSIRKVIDPEAYKRAKGDRSRHDCIRLYLVKSPVISSSNNAVAMSQEEMRVSRLIGSMPDGYREMTPELLQRGLSQWAREYNKNVKVEELKSRNPVTLVLEEGEWSHYASSKNKDLGGEISGGRFRVDRVDTKGIFERVFDKKVPDYDYEKVLQNMLYSKGEYILDWIYFNWDGTPVYFMRPTDEMLRLHGE